VLGASCISSQICLRFPWPKICHLQNCLIIELISYIIDTYAGHSHQEGSQELPYV
jgi:hypothetical protein